MEIMSMSTKEISRLEVIQKVKDKRMSQKEVAHNRQLITPQDSGDRAR